MPRYNDPPTTGEQEDWTGPSPKTCPCCGEEYLVSGIHPPFFMQFKGPLRNYYITYRHTNPSTPWHVVRGITGDTMSRHTRKDLALAAVEAYIENQKKGG